MLVDGRGTVRSHTPPIHTNRTPWEVSREMGWPHFYFHVLPSYQITGPGRHLSFLRGPFPERQVPC